MLPQFMAHDEVRRESGVSQVVDISGAQGHPLLLTLGITRIIQQESLDVEIYGSPDGEFWTSRPIAVFPKKYYCGTYSILLDSSDLTGIRFLRAAWKMCYWGCAPVRPLFSFYLWASPTTHEAELSTGTAPQYMIPASSIV